MKILLTLLLSVIATIIQAQDNEQYQTFSLVGTCKVTQVGSCSMTTEPHKVKLVFSIDKQTGKVAGQEFLVVTNEPDVKLEQVEWTGEVLNSQAIRLQQIKKISCVEGERTEILHYIGVIKCSDENICKMKLSDTYAMCPEANCIFDIEYNLELK